MHTKTKHDHNTNVASNNNTHDDYVCAYVSCFPFAESIFLLAIYSGFLHTVHVYLLVEWLEDFSVSIALAYLYGYVRTLCMHAHSTACGVVFIGEWRAESFSSKAKLQRWKSFPFPNNSTITYLFLPEL